MAITIQTESENGQRYTITESAPPVIDAGHMGDPGAAIPGRLRSYSTKDGHTVNRLDDETFEILAPTGSIRVRRVQA